jgi:resuscitation-promoting factor RpfA
MTERRDEELSNIYREAEGPRPPQRVDDNILAASQRVAGNVRRRTAFGLPRRWGTPVALAATVLVSSTVALMVFERQSGVDVLAPQAPRAERPVKAAPPPRASPAEPQRPAPSEKSPVAEPPRADSLEKSPPMDRARAAPAAPGPQAASRSDRVQQHTVETALSGERRGTGQPARVPAIPPGVEILRKSEEPKAKPLPDAQRVLEAQQPTQALQAPPAPVPAPGANALRESAAAAQGTVGGLASRVAVSEAKERTPEKWLADIRKLKSEGKAAEAERELAEFKKRHPDYIVPEDLR